MRLIVLIDEADCPDGHSCRLPLLRSMMINDWVHGMGHSPVCQILLHIVVTCEGDNPGFSQPEPVLLVCQFSFPEKWGCHFLQ